MSGLVPAEDGEAEQLVPRLTGDIGTHISELWNRGWSLPKLRLLHDCL